MSRYMGLDIMSLADKSPKELNDLKKKLASECRYMAYGFVEDYLEHCLRLRIVVRRLL